MIFDKVFKRTDLYDEGTYTYLVGAVEKGFFGKTKTWYKATEKSYVATTNPKYAATFSLEDAFREIGRYKIVEVKPYG